MTRFETTLAGLAVAAALFAGTPAGLAQMNHGAMQMDGASKAYMDAMSTMESDMAAMEMTGKPGVDFASMMIPHHQSAIDMARAYLASGENDPELTKLSNKVIAAQEGEIAFLKAWLARNGR